MNVEQKRMKLLMSLSIGFIFVYIINWYLFSRLLFSCYGLIYILVWYFFPFLILSISTLFLAKGKGVNSIPWVMLGTNIFILVLCLISLEAREGPILFIKAVATLLLLPLTYTSLVFVILDIGAISKNVPKGWSEADKCKKSAVLILFFVPLILFLSSIISMIIFLLSDVVFSDRILIPPLLFIFAFFILLSSGIIYFIRNPKKARDIKSQQTKLYKENRKNEVFVRSRRDMIYAILIVLLIIIGDSMFFCYYDKVRDLYPKEPFVFLRGEMLYEENESTNSTVVFSLRLSAPKKASFEDIYIWVQDKENNELNFTQEIIDKNSNGYFDTGDKMVITLTNGEFSSGYRVHLALSYYHGLMTYEFS